MGSMAGHTMPDAHGAQANAASPNAEASAAESQKQYKLEAALGKDGEQYVIDIDTDLTFSSSEKPVYGEGHIHFYVNGKLTGPIIMTNGPYPVEDYMLSDGDNTIRLALVNNNHAEIQCVRRVEDNEERVNFEGKNGG